MKVNVTNEEFEVLCKKYNDPIANELEKGGPKGYIQKCGVIISYLKFLEDLDHGIDEELRESFSLRTTPSLYFNHLTNTH